MLDDSITSKNKKSQGVKIYPEIVLSAARNKNAGAIRLWILGKHFDQSSGGGFISSQEFRHFIINDLKWKPGTFDRYLNKAEHLGIIERRGKGNYYRLAAADIAALAVGCEHVGAPETIKLKRFAGKCWLAYTYAAFMRRYNGNDVTNSRIISARTISEKTGIPIRTIYHYDRLLGKGIKKQRNYAIHAEVKTDEDFYNLKVEKGRNVFENRNTGQVYERLPNKRFISAKIANEPKHIKINRGDPEALRSIQGITEIVQDDPEAASALQGMIEIVQDKTEIVDTIRGMKDKINRKINTVIKTLVNAEGLQQVYLKRYIDNGKAKDRKIAAGKLRALLNKKGKRGEKTDDFIYRREFELRGIGYYAAI